MVARGQIGVWIQGLGNRVYNQIDKIVVYKYNNIVPQKCEAREGEKMIYTYDEIRLKNMVREALKEKKRVKSGDVTLVMSAVSIRANTRTLDSKMNTRIRRKTYAVRDEGGG